MVICSRRKENVAEATKQLHALGLKDVVGLVCHVGTTEARKYLVAETLKRFGAIDILVSNVACNPVRTCTPPQMQAIAVFQSDLCCR